jgi:hypothetical protein
LFAWPSPGCCGVCFAGPLDFDDVWITDPTPVDPVHNHRTGQPITRSLIAFDH